MSNTKCSIETVNHNGVKCASKGYGEEYKTNTNPTKTPQTQRVVCGHFANLSGYSGTTVAMTTTPCQTGEINKTKRSPAPST